MPLDENVGGVDVGTRIADGFKAMEDIGGRQIEAISALHQGMLGSNAKVAQDIQATLAQAIADLRMSVRQQTPSAAQNAAQVGGTQSTNQGASAAGAIGQAGMGGTGGGSSGTGGGQGGQGGASGPPGGGPGSSGAPGGSPSPGGGGNSFGLSGRAGQVVSTISRGLNRLPPPPPMPVGGGVTNGLWAQAKSFVPSIGWLQAGMQEWRSQQDKNNFYRSVAGRSHGEAIEDRFAEEGWRFRTMTKFGEAEARQAFKGVTALGYTGGNEGAPGQDRSDAMKFVYEGKKDYGSTVTESLGVLSTASRSALVDLGALNKELDSLSTVAGNAGVNAQQARAQMESLLDAAIRSGQGTSAGITAAGNAEALASMGRGFSNLDPSKSMTDQGYRYMVAAHNGMNITEFNTMDRSDPARAANMGTEFLIERARSYLGSNWATLQGMVDQNIDRLKEDPAPVSKELAQDFWNTNPSIDPNAFLGIISQFAGTGNISDHFQATAYLIQQMAGMTPGAKIAQKQANAGRTDLQGRSKARGSKGARAKFTDDGVGGLVGGAGEKGFDALRSHGNGALGWKATDATENYIAGAKKTGTRSGVLERTLMHFSESEQEQQMVEVNANGKRRVVSLAEAMKNFSAQLASGRAKFVGGDDDGKSAALGGDLDTSRATQRAAASEAKKAKPTVGQSMDEYEKKHPSRGREQGSYKGMRLKIEYIGNAGSNVRVTGFEEDDAEGLPRGTTGSGVMTYGPSGGAAYGPGVR